MPINPRNIDALASIYRATGHIVGTWFFRQTARQYLRACAGTTGDRARLGEQFPEFLTELRALRSVPFAPDLARLEWARHAVGLAPDDRRRIDAEQLARIGEREWPRLRFDLNVATALVASRYPILRLWLAHQDGGEPLEDVGTAESGVQLLVLRGAMLLLGRGEYALLHALAAGQALEDAHQRARLANRQFDLAGTLAGLLQRAVLVGARPLPAMDSRPTSLRTAPLLPFPAAWAAAGPATARSR